MAKPVPAVLGMLRDRSPGTGLLRRGGARPGPVRPACLAPAPALYNRVIDQHGAGGGTGGGRVP